MVEQGNGDARAAPGEPGHQRRALLARRVALGIVVVVLGLLPWTAYLAYTLPAHYNARHWNVLWVGFDAVLIAVLGYTAWAAWFRRQVLIATAIVASTLLLCDAWFDVVTSFGTREEALTMVTAFAGEVPLAVALAVLAWRGMTRTVRAFYELSDAGGPVPRLRDATMLTAWARERPRGNAGATRPPRGR